jgi:hypothetical protein
MFRNNQIPMTQQRPPAEEVAQGLTPTCAKIMALAKDGYEFRYVCDIKPLRNHDGTLQLLMPQVRYRNVRNLPLNAYGAGPFCKFTISKNFRASGVYALTVDAELRYIGKCADLSARFNAGYGNISPKNCFKGGQQTNCRLNNLICSSAQAGQCIALWFFRTTDHKGIEASLRQALKPAWNRI